jgi:hypothetical protein
MRKLCVILLLSGCASSKTSAPVSQGTDSDSSADGASDSIGDGSSAACPEFATACPAGCVEDPASEFIEASSCLGPLITVRCVSLETGCTGSETCLARESTGKLYRFSGDCHIMAGWRPCTSDENEKVTMAGNCGAADAADTD